MQEPSKSAFNPLTWVLLLVVIGLVALLWWYGGTLREDLTHHKAKIAQGAQQLVEAKGGLERATQTEKGLRGEIQDQTGRLEAAERATVALKQQDAEVLAAEQQKAAEAIAAEQQKATEALTALQQKATEALTALQQKDAEALAAEQRKAADAAAAMQGQLDAATQKIAALGSDIEGLKQAQVDAAARHEAQLTAAEQQYQAKLQAVEAQLNERIAGLRTALEGSDPERAALFAGFEQRLQAGHEAVAALEATKTDLSGQLASAKQTLDERAAALTEATQRIEAAQGELTQTRGELAQLQAQHDASMDKAAMDQAGLQAQHAAALEKAAQERAVLEADQAAALAQAAKEQADLKDQHAAAIDQAAKAKADLEANHAAALDQAAKAKADLEANHAAALDQAAKAKADLEASHAAALDQAAKAKADLEAQHAAALDQAAQDAAALKARLEGDLAQAQATHSSEIGQAKDKIGTLTAGLAAETAALAALQAKHDQMVADLSGKLADTDKTLAGVRADLATTTQAAADQKAALERQIAEAKGRIAQLEGTLASERQANEAAQLAARQAHAKALASQHDLLVKVSELGGRETEKGLLLSLAEADLNFPVSKATLPAGDLPSLDRMAALLAQFPDITARIEGHTDAAGRDETNLALSQARADAVKQALVDRGIAVERLTAVGIGETRPIGSNATKAGSRQNRRVEVYIIEAAR